jgi:hypothetical protein
MPENPTAFILEVIFPKTVGVSDLRSSGHFAVLTDMSVENVRTFPALTETL